MSPPPPGGKSNSGASEYESMEESAGVNNSDEEVASADDISGDESPVKETTSGGELESVNEGNDDDMKEELTPSADDAILPDEASVLLVEENAEESNTTNQSNVQDATNVAMNDTESNDEVLVQDDSVKPDSYEGGCTPVVDPSPSSPEVEGDSIPPNASVSEPAPLTESENAPNGNETSNSTDEQDEEMKPSEDG